MHSSKSQEPFGGARVQHCPEQGWAGAENGELLTFAEEASFAAFITIDQGIEYQQNLRGRNIAIVLIQAASSRLADLLPYVPGILKVLLDLQAGQLVKVGSGTPL